MSKKADIVNELAARKNLKKKEAEEIVNEFLKIVQEKLAEDGKVQLIGFGTFEITERAGHIGRNPRTCEVIKIGARKHMTFTASKKLRDFFNGQEAASEEK